MKNNRAYVPVDVVSLHQDFDVWYADGEAFLKFTGPWSSERDKVTIFGRMGGEMGCIKPDPKALAYYLKLERWEYVFHTRRIFKDYYVNGMRWQINGSLSNPPLDFLLEDEREEGDLVKDVHVRVVDFKNRGQCFEVRSKDVAKLRIAVAAVVAMAVKEEYRGLSEGLDAKNASRLKRMKNWIFSGKGKTYEELLADEALTQGL